MKRFAARVTVDAYVTVALDADDEEQARIMALDAFDASDLVYRDVEVEWCKEVIV